LTSDDVGVLLQHLREIHHDPAVANIWIVK
jgi:hypothetical protein